MLLPHVGQRIRTTGLSFSTSAMISSIAFAVVLLVLRLKRSQIYSLSVYNPYRVTVELDDTVFTHRFGEPKYSY